MRVLYFTDNNSDHNQRFLEKLAHSGHEILYLSLCGAPSSTWLPEKVQLVRSEQTFPRHSHPATIQSFVSELRNTLKKLKPDLVHAGPIQSSAYLAVLAGAHPLLAMSWGSDILVDAERDLDWKKATTTVLTEADGLFCDCDAVRKRAEKLAPAPVKYVVQFPWGLKAGQFGPDGEQVRLPWTEQEIVFLSTRTWEPMYGIGVLLDAFSLAQLQFPQLRLVLVGHGSLEEEIRTFIEGHSLGGKIMMQRSVSGAEMPKYFRAVHAYISCTPSDGTSISLLEAMATGLPAIVADNPSNREWLVEGVNGWFGEPHRADSFALKIGEVAVMNSSSRAQAAAVSQQTVRERADWDKNFPFLLRAYSDLLCRVHRP